MQSWQRKTTGEVQLQAITTGDEQPSEAPQVSENSSILYVKRRIGNDKKNRSIEI